MNGTQMKQLIDIIVKGDVRDTEILPYEDPIVKKKCRHYSYILVSNALKMGYEEVEIAKVVALIGTTMNFDTECKTFDIYLVFLVFLKCTFGFGFCRRYSSIHGGYAG